MTASTRSRALAANVRGAALLGCLVASACTYDFDHFVQSSGAGAPSGTSGSHAAGGTSARDDTGGDAGRLVTGGTAGGGGHGENAGSSGNAGRADGGEAGADTMPSGGKGGRVSNGGTSGAAAAAGHAGAAAGGKASGTGGTSSGAGQGGTHAAGSGGAPPNTAGTSSSSCSGTTIGGHCYFVIGEDSGLDWPSAKTACEGYSKTTHLVTITSDSEQTALIKAFFPTKTDTWIGLSLADPSKSPDASCKLEPDQCPFHWVTGEALDYTDWSMRSSSDKEPNYTGSCVRIQASDQAWADTGCTGSKYRAICEDG